MKLFDTLLLFLVSAGCVTHAWAPSSAFRSMVTRPELIDRMNVSLAASVKEKQQEKAILPEETTKKFGLEAGILQSMKQNDGGEAAKLLLKQYGIAYLATSIPLALISFIIFYFLVDNGVDVAGLLKQIGIENVNGEKAGTFALAYAAHKATSPIRFPPTVILTPVVAKLLGKEPDEDDEA
jgi:Protein of unknown function (DUF1279)